MAITLMINLPRHVERCLHFEQMDARSKSAQDMSLAFSTGGIFINHGNPHFSFVPYTNVMRIACQMTSVYTLLIPDAVQPFHCQPDIIRCSYCILTCRTYVSSNFTMHRPQHYYINPGCYCLWDMKISSQAYAITRHLSLLHSPSTRLPTLHLYLVALFPRIKKCRVLAEFPIALWMGGATNTMELVKVTAS